MAQDFRMAIMLSEEVTTQLIELAAQMGIPPAELVSHAIDAMYKSRNKIDREVSNVRG